MTAKAINFSCSVVRSPEPGAEPVAVKSSKSGLFNPLGNFFSSSFRRHLQPQGCRCETCGEAGNPAAGVRPVGRSAATEVRTSGNSLSAFDDPNRALYWASVQLPESKFIETIIDAIDLATGPDNFRVIRGAIGNVRSAVNRQSLKMMLEDREKEVA